MKFQSLPAQIRFKAYNDTEVQLAARLRDTEDTDRVFGLINVKIALKPHFRG